MTSLLYERTPKKSIEFYIEFVLYSLNVIGYVASWRMIPLPIDALPLDMLN
jgi:hypothetical protein